MPVISVGLGHLHLHAFVGFLGSVATIGAIGRYDRGSWPYYERSNVREPNGAFRASRSESGAFRASRTDRGSSGFTQAASSTRSLTT